MIRAGGARRSCSVLYQYKRFRPVFQAGFKAGQANSVTICFLLSGGGVDPPVDVPRGDEILQVKPVVLAQAAVDDHQLDLHLFGQDALDVDADRLAGAQVGAALGQPRRLGAISTKVPYSSMLRTIPTTVSPAEKAAAFSAQLPKSSRMVSTTGSGGPGCGWRRGSAAPPTPVGGGGDAAHRHAVDGQQGADAAAHIAGRPPKDSMWVTVQGRTSPGTR